MPDFVLVLIAGFAASMVDGALGMGFGPTSSTILLSGGVPPALASATVNLAKVATGAASGISHWRLRNVDRRLALRLAVPGALGAAFGATVLRRVDGDQLRPWLAILLLAMGVRILYRMRLPATPAAGHDAPANEHGRGCEVAGAIGGVTNGLVGAWGPVVTPYLLHKEPFPASRWAP